MKEKERPPPLTGGPLGLGDPDDKRLRKTERDIIIPKMIREEATRRCDPVVKKFLDCCTNGGMLFPLKCKEENDARVKCMQSYGQNPEFIQEITDKYLHARSYFRRTGEPLEKYVRKKVVVES